MEEESVLIILLQREHILPLLVYIWESQHREEDQVMEEEGHRLLILIDEVADTQDLDQGPGLTVLVGIDSSS